MKHANRIRGGTIAALALVFMASLTAVRRAQAQTESVIYSFCMQNLCSDGTNPASNLIMDSQGNMYGTAVNGGTEFWGTVFKLTPGGAQTVLYNFCVVGGDSCTDGSAPVSGLVMDSAGNLYGTTRQGGAHGPLYGTVFKLSPNGTLTTLHSFNSDGIDGVNPLAGLVMDSKGNLYGTTYLGGASNAGVVYRVTPKGKETIVHSFEGGLSDGSGPANMTLVKDSQGNLYGTTAYGGTHGGGTVFKISAQGGYSILYNFGATKTDGINPEAGLTVDPKGNLYGTNISGGKYGIGTVFRVSPSGTENILHSFQNNHIDGYNCYASLIRDSQGNLYGVTYQGGANGSGVLFKISPKGVETVLHAFGSGSDGINPQGSLLLDSQGNLYGTTYFGGSGGNGAVFEVTP
jgi:uncharacterized repeat protein (TIGR03803 family)